MGFFSKMAMAGSRLALARLGLFLGLLKGADPTTEEATAAGLLATLLLLVGLELSFAGGERAFLSRASLST